MPESENGIGNIGVVDIWAAEGVIFIDGFSEFFGAGALGEEWDERIGVIFAVPFHSGKFAWAVTGDVIPRLS